MSNYLYIVNDLVFENEEGKHNAKSRASWFCKKHGISTNTIMRVNDEVELAYYQLLRDKENRGELSRLETHSQTILVQSFYNANKEFMTAVLDTIPFVFTDSKGVRHYQYLVSCLKDLNAQLIARKYMFDMRHLVDKNYLELIYLDNDGSFKEWKLDEIETLRKMYRQKIHKEMLEKIKKIREKQKYDRLLKLREEGKITDNQRKELYRLEGIYERG